MDSEDALVAECMHKLRDAYTPIAGIVCGSAAYRPSEALDLDLCIIVEEDVCDRAVLTICDVSVDLFVCGAPRTEREMKQGHQAHLLRFNGASPCDI